MKSFWSENAQTITLVLFVGVLGVASDGWWIGGKPISLFLALAMLLLLLSWSFIFDEMHNRVLILVLFVWMLHVAIREFAGIYCSYRVDSNGKPLSVDDCYYLSLYAWSGFGFLDARPKSEAQFWVALEVCFGYIMNAALVAVLLNVVKPWRIRS